MCEYKRMLCLASSRKRSGYCVAGIAAEPDGTLFWLRPVGAYGDALSRVDCWLAPNRRMVQPLDVVKIPVARRLPEDYQTENWQIDPNAPWMFDRVVGPGDAECTLARLVERPATLWTLGMSTKSGVNDGVHVDRLGGVDRSLHLIRVSSLKLRVLPHAWKSGELRVQGAFEYNGVAYALWITDPRIENEYKAKGLGEYAHGGAYLTISLGRPYENAVYKLIAAVMPVG